MTYVLNERTSGSRISSGTSTYDGSSFIDATTSYDCVYSWRTGKSVNLDKMLPEPGSDGNIAERLLARKRVVERQLGELELGAKGNDSNILTRDFGHDFGVVHFKTFSTGGSASFVYDKGRTYEQNYEWNNPVPSSAPRLLLNGSYVSDTVGAFIPDMGTFFRDKGATLLSPNTSYNPSTLAPNGLDRVGSSSRMINDMNPYSNQASFLATATELLRGDIPQLLPKLRKHRDQILRLKKEFKTYKQAAKFIGQQSLNVQFGWAPIMRDIAAGIELLISIDRALFPSDSTRRRRKRVIFEASHLTDRSVDWCIAPHLTDRYSGWSPGPSQTALWNSRSPSGFVQRASLATHLAIRGTADVWTTAKFRTGLSPNAVSNGYLDRGIDLLGLRLTPEVVWELTPWSWLIDWFSNTGTIIANVSTLGATNALLNYAYSTLRYRFSCSYNAVRPNIPETPYFGMSGFTGYKGQIGFLEEYDMKIRGSASPFGFSVSTEALTGGQWGILASLGLARSR